MGVLLLHALFLAGCGYYGAASHDFAPKAMHSLYSGAGGGGVLLLCAIMSVSGSYKAYMIGVHIGLILQLTFTGVFAVQSYRSFGVPEKADRHYLFVLMAAGSAAALYGMMKFKPKKEKK